MVTKMDVEIIKLLAAIISLLVAVIALTKPNKPNDSATTSMANSTTTRPKKTLFKSSVILASFLMILALPFVSQDWHTFVISCSASMVANIVIVACYYE